MQIKFTDRAGGRYVAELLSDDERNITIKVIKARKNLVGKSILFSKAHILKMEIVSL
jgi:hypothetical protein